MKEGVIEVPDTYLSLKERVTQRHANSQLPLWQWKLGYISTRYRQRNSTAIRSRKENLIYGCIKKKSLCKLDTGTTWSLWQRGDGQKYVDMALRLLLFRGVLNPPRRAAIQPGFVSYRAFCRDSACLWESFWLPGMTKKSCLDGPRGLGSVTSKVMMLRATDPRTTPTNRNERALTEWFLSFHRSFWEFYLTFQNVCELVRKTTTTKNR